MAYGKHHLITLVEAAQMLGIKPSTLRHWRWRWKDACSLKAIKIGKLVKYRVKDLEKFIEKGGGKGGGYKNN